MKKERKSSNRQVNIKKKYIVVILTLLIVALCLIIIVTFLNNNKASKETTKSNNSVLWGEAKVNAETNIFELIDKYLKSIPNLRDYIEQNDIKKLSITDLKEKFNIDISEFTKLKYNCNPDYTSVDFSKGYDDYVISLTCDAFLIKD